MKAALVVCWETKRAFDHLGAHHFPMPFLKHDYQEMFPLTLDAANSTQAPSHIWLLFIQRGLRGPLRHILWREKSLRAVVRPQSSVTLSHVPFPARSPPTTAAIWSTELPIIGWKKIDREARMIGPSLLHNYLKTALDHLLSHAWFKWVIYTLHIYTCTQFLFIYVFILRSFFFFF